MNAQNSEAFGEYLTGARCLEPGSEWLKEANQVLGESLLLKKVSFKSVSKGPGPSTSRRKTPSLGKDEFEKENPLFVFFCSVACTAPGG